MIKLSWHAIVIAYLATLKRFFLDKGLVPVLILAPLFYGFYYPWAVETEFVRQVPVAVVDYDNSDLSRQLIRYASASPGLKIVLVTNNEPAVQKAMIDGEIFGYAVFAKQLKYQVSHNKKASIEVFANASYAMFNKEVSNGFYQAFSAVSTQLAIKKSLYNGASLQLQDRAKSPIQYSTQALFNPLQGYASYLVPAVFMLIVHQIIIIGIATAVGTWSERGHLPQTPEDWLGASLFFCTLGWYVVTLLLGWMIGFHDYARGGNGWGMLLLLLCLVPTLCACGICLGLILANREKPMQFMIFSSMPILFISGYVWPGYLLPELLQWLRWLIPNTAALTASIKLSQMGASIADVKFEFAVLFVLMLIALGCAIFLIKKQKKNILTEITH